MTKYGGGVMPAAGDKYIVEVESSHIDWGEYRNATKYKPIKGESYVKIPSKYAKLYDIRCGDMFVAHFKNNCPSIQIKASGNGPCENGIQYAKQFEGVGVRASRAFTPWYKSCDVTVGDQVAVTFLTSTDIVFEIL